MIKLKNSIYIITGSLPKIVLKLKFLDFSTCKFQLTVDDLDILVSL